MGYFERALIAAALIGFTCGLVGVSVTLRRRTFFAQALTHATYPGAVGAAALGWSIPLGAAVAAVVIVGAMLLVSRLGRQGQNVASGIVLTAGFALGAVLQGVIPGLPVRPDTFLVGSVLAVSWGDITLAAVVGSAAIFVHLIWGRRLVYSTIDPLGFRASGLRVWPIDVVILTLTAAVVVTALPAVGAILAIALIAAPSIAARALAKSYRGILVIAPVAGAISGVAGVYLSRLWNLPAGPAIVLFASALALFALGLSRIRTASQTDIGAGQAFTQAMREPI